MKIRWHLGLLTYTFSLMAEEPSSSLFPFPEIAHAERFSREDYLYHKELAQNSSSVRKKAPPSCQGDPTSHLQIGVNYTYLSLTPHGFSSFGGSLGGLQAAYEFRSWERIYGAVTFNWRQGNTHGQGTHRSVLDLKTEERIGYSFGCKKNNWIVSLFSGLGYRHVGQSVPVIASNYVLGSEGTTSIDFDYNTFYMPIGVLADWQTYTTVALGLNFTWMPQVYPTLKIQPLKGARWILKDQLANFLVEVPITVLVSRKYDCTLIVKPFFEYWRDGSTTAETIFGTTLGLPGNTYLFGGLELNFCYNF